MIPSENPALFCKAALLPSLHHGPGAPHMPAPGHRSHLGRLSERPNPHRNLLFIEPIDELSNDVSTFQSDLPSTTTHAQPRQVQNPFLNLLNTSSDSIICVASAVRRTILSATELVLSNLQYQWFSSQNYAHLAQGVATMYWSTKKPSLVGSTGSPTGSTSSYTLCEPELPQATVAAFVQEPWVLSPHDFDTFCSLRELRNYVPKFRPNTPIMPHDAPWGQAQQLWAFIHDRCEERQCHFFIVTSYEQWAFGCFSQGWTRAFITPPYSCNDAQPTIMERTLHWVLSATLQSEHKSNKYVAPRDLPWMNSLYVAPEIIGEHSWAVAKPGKRRLAEEDDLPTSSIINPSPSPAPRLKATLPPRPIHTAETRVNESIDAPEYPFPPTARPSALVAGVNAWRQRIPPRNKARNKRRSGDATPDMDIFPSEPVPHASLFRPTGRAFTPSRHTAISINSPERLRLPPLLQSPARQGSVRSEHSGDTALDRTDGLSMQVVVADTQLPRDITSLSISDSQSYAVPVEAVQSRPSVSVYREHTPHLPVAPSPRGLTPTVRATRSSVPRRTTRLISKRLREAHLAGTLSTLTEDSGRFSRT